MGDNVFTIAATTPSNPFLSPLVSDENSVQPKSKPQKETSNDQTEVRFPVSPNLALPEKQLSKGTIQSILSSSANRNAYPTNYYLTGIWDKNYQKMELINEQSIIPHPFIEAAYFAYNYHYPLKIKVTDVWLLILQSASIHINKCSEELRTQFVTFSGKLQLTIFRNNFELDSFDNDWGGVAKEFVDRIGMNTREDFSEILKTKFSISTAVDEVATAMTLMEAMKNYFMFGISTMCGFPYIVLSGSKEDWDNLKSSSQRLLVKLGDFGSNWSKSLLPLLDKMTEPFDKSKPIDDVFWNAMIKLIHTSGSGSSSYISGWVNIFFPYLYDRHDSYLNEYCQPYDINNVVEKASFWVGAPEYDQFPKGLCVAPVQWEYIMSTFDLNFYSGFLGVKQDDDGLISPQVGWYIMKKKDLVDN